MSIEGRQSLSRSPRETYIPAVTDDPRPVYDPTYPARRVLDLIADKWTPVVLYCLSGGTRRFSELHGQIPDISKKMLIQTLRRLEGDGIVHRKVYAVVPPKTEYNLTDLGRRMHEPIALICDWAVEHTGEIDEVLEHRRASKAGSEARKKPASDVADWYASAEHLERRIERPSR